MNHMQKSIQERKRMLSKYFNKWPHLKGNKNFNMQQSKTNSEEIQETVFFPFLLQTPEIFCQKEQKNIR